MQIVIDIDDNVYTRLFDNGTDFYDTDDRLAMAKAIRKGEPLPKGHGRLVDGDALLAVFEEDISEQTKYMELFASMIDMKRYFDISRVQTGMISCRNVLDNAETIIPADKVESEE